MTKEYTYKDILVHEVVVEAINDLYFREKYSIKQIYKWFKKENFNKKILTEKNIKEFIYSNENIEKIFKTMFRNKK